MSAARRLHAISWSEMLDEVADYLAGYLCRSKVSRLYRVKYMSAVSNVVAHAEKLKGVDVEVVTVFGNSLHTPKSDQTRAAILLQWWSSSRDWRRRDCRSEVAIWLLSTWSDEAGATEAVGVAREGVVVAARWSWRGNTIASEAIVAEIAAVVAAFEATSAEMRATTHIAPRSTDHTLTIGTCWSVLG